MPLRYDYEGWVTGPHTSGITSTAFSPNGKYLAAGGLDGLVSIWTLSNLKLYHTFVGNSPVTSVAWNPNETAKLIFGTIDGMICILELFPVCYQVFRSALTLRYINHTNSWGKGRFGFERTELASKS